MSDGNFNRALLPGHELSAGIRAGKAQMRTKAQQAFEQTIREFFPDTSREQMTQMQEHFNNELRK